MIALHIFIEGLLESDNHLLLFLSRLPGVEAGPML